MATPLEISEPFIILVEGRTDTAFFRALLNEHALGGFDVFSPNDLDEKLGGRPAFTRLLNVLPFSDGFADVEGLLLVSDSDENPVDSFKEVQEAIARSEAFGEPRHSYPIPSAPKVKAAGTPSMAVYMIPSERLAGGLETLYFEAAKVNHGNNVACIDALMKCASTTGWSTMKAAKAKVRSLVAVTCERKPDASLHSVLELEPTLFPMSAAVFDEILVYLRAFPKLIRG